MADKSIERNIDLLLRLATLEMDAGSRLSAATYSFLDYMDKDKTAKALNKNLRKDEMYVTVANPECAKNLSRRLDAKKILHMTLYDANKDTNYLVYAKSDAAKVRMITDQFRSEINEKGNLEKRVLFAGNPDVKKIQNLDVAEAMLFSEHATKAKIPFSLQEYEKNKYLFYYHTYDYDKMDNVKKMVSLELSGVHGDAYKKQLEYENENYIEAIKQLNGDKAVVISGKNNVYIEANKDSITFHENETVLSVSKTQKDFYNISNYMLANVKEPVVMTPDQFEDYCSCKNKEKFRAKVDSENGRPTLSPEQYIALKKFEENLSLYEQKMQLDNADQEFLECSFENNELRMASFTEINSINRDMIHDKEHTFDKDVEFLDQARSNYFGYEDIDDYKSEESQNIEEAVLYERDEYLTEIEDFEDLDQDYLDFLNDRNGNMIPDQYELDLFDEN